MCGDILIKLKEEVTEQRYNDLSIKIIHISYKVSEILQDRT